MRLGDLATAFEQLWPLEQAETWDNPGLAFGNRNVEVSKVLLSVDVTPDVIAEASDSGAQLILSHHPVLFRPISTLAGFGATQTVLDAAISANIALYSAHTNADHVLAGVSETFANTLGLIELEPLDAISSHGRIGTLVSEISLLNLAKRLSEILPATALGTLVQGSREMSVKKIAVLAGAGDSFLDTAAASGADVYITSDLRHHRALDFAIATKDRPMGLISVSHWAAESLWLEVCAAQLGQELPNIEFIVSHLNTDPWDFSI